MTRDDSWRDADADSGVRLTHWLSESDDRDVKITRFNDPDLGTNWIVELLECRCIVATGRNPLLDEAWCQALAELDRRTPTIRAAAASHGTAAVEPGHFTASGPGHAY